MKIPWTSIASVFLALAVILGAFGAHGLKDKLDLYSMEVYGKANFYHFIHGIGMLLVSMFPALQILAVKHTNWICILFLVGIIIFSGSLYILAITKIRWLGAITPIGGVLFILGWALLGWLTFKRN